MSSWLSFSLPNPFKSSDGDDRLQNPTSSSSPTLSSPALSHGPSSVKDDLSVLTQTIGLQLRGVAAFLAPPPPSTDTTSADHSSAASSSTTITGIKNDLVEIGGSLKTSLSLLSSNKAVSEISRFASNFLRFEDGGDEGEGDQDEYEDEEEAVGITEEVFQFVEEISLRPECWTDFPLSLHSDFSMSDLQKEHAETIERLVPALTALREKVCGDLSNEQFWLIYFVLLLPRLEENDFKLLSTPEIVETRDTLLQKLRKERNASVETSEELGTVHACQDDVELNSKRDKSPPQVEEVPSGPGNSEQGIESDDHKNTVQWPGDQDDRCASVDARIPLENEDDVSFSDLEDDDNDLSRRLAGVKPAQGGKMAMQSESNEWVQLNETTKMGSDLQMQKVRRSISKDKVSEGEESSDWLNVDDIDLDSLESS